jgi:hypothetical protein
MIRKLSNLGLKLSLAGFAGLALSVLPAMSAPIAVSKGLRADDSQLVQVRYGGGGRGGAVHRGGVGYRGGIGYRGGAGYRGGLAYRGGVAPRAAVVGGGYYGGSGYGYNGGTGPYVGAGFARAAAFGTSYGGGPYAGYAGWDEYARVNGIKCGPGNTVKFEDGLTYLCQ